MGEKMGFYEVFLIGVGLSMDAFAASICKGLNMKIMKKTQVFIIALFFGGFQALMPFVGWIFGKQFESYITRFDHWIAFFLLAFLGSKMTWDVTAGKQNNEMENASTQSIRLDLKELFLLAVATSIDALAVGISFAFLQVQILYAITIIGCTTFVLSAVGVLAGHTFGSRYADRAALAGGGILILIGLKILLEHLGIL